MKSFKRLIATFIISILFTSIKVRIYSQSSISSMPHTEAVSKIVSVNYEKALDKEFFTAGQDGFVTKWTGNKTGEHYQVSEFSIKILACSHDKNKIAVYETNGGLINRVSLWDWQRLTRIYALRFKDTVTSLTFSAKDTYLIVGVASVEGALFLNLNTGKFEKKIKTQTGLVSSVYTSATEKTAVMYSPIGNLTYYDLEKGGVKKKVSCEALLEHVTLFNNQLLIAGIKDGTIYIINAITGQNIKVIQATEAENAKLIEDVIADELNYLTTDGRGNYSLYRLVIAEDNKSATAKLIKEYRGPRGEEKITYGIVDGGDLILGDKEGNIYEMDTVFYGTADPFTLITEKTVLPIFDVQKKDNGFYFLTTNNVIYTEPPATTTTTVCESGGYNSFFLYGTSLIFFNKGKRDPVILQEGEKKTTLFTPEASLETLHLVGDLLVAEEGSASVYSFDIKNKVKKSLYKGAGLQDAILNDTLDTLYIAASASTAPYSTLLKVDTSTLETVPVNLGGQIAYSLNYFDKGADKEIYAILVENTGEVINTNIVKYNTVKKTKSTLLRIKSEDNDAFTSLSYPFIYTNIGRDGVRSCNLSTNKITLYLRTASIPMKTCQNQNTLLTINKDGSVSLYDTSNAGSVKSKAASYVWQYSTDGFWQVY